MTNCAVTTLPDGNDFATAPARGGGLSPRDATALTGAIIRTTLTIAVLAPSAINRERGPACRLQTHPSKQRSVPFRSVQSVNA